MSDSEVFILEDTLIDGVLASAILVNCISSLHNETLDNPVKRSTIVTEFVTLLINKVSFADSAEVLRGLRYFIPKQPDLDLFQCLLSFELYIEGHIRCDGSFSCRYCVFWDIVPSFNVTDDSKQAKQSQTDQKFSIS